MASGAPAESRGFSFRIRRRVDDAYARGGARFLRRALIAQLGTALLVSAVGSSLTLIYVSLTPGELAIIDAMALALWTVDSILRVRVIRSGVEPVDRWEQDRSEANALRAWDSLVELPFKTLRARLPNAVLACMIISWDAIGGWLIDLSAGQFLFFLPGSILVVFYVLALRFFLMEQLVKPALSDLGADLPDGGGSAMARVTLAQRLLVAVPAITIITGTVVAGLVGEREVSTIAVGVAVSVGVAVLIASWLVGLLADSVAAPIAELERAAERVGTGDLNTRVPVVSTDETGSLARSFNQMVEGLRERERIRETFGTYVDPDVAEHILGQGTDLAGEEAEVSLLFMDIRGFTTYSETREPQAVVARLNDLYGQVVPVITEHGGHANKFIGDGLLAVFGAPARLPDHAKRAVEAGLAIARLVRERYAGELRVGIGVNTGRALVGAIGGGGRLDFTVIGDAVNTAARVESATRQTDDDLLITEATRRRLSDGLGKWEERPPISLKGKSEEVRLYCSTALAREGAAEA